MTKKKDQKTIDEVTDKDVAMAEAEIEAIQDNPVADERDDTIAQLKRQNELLMDRMEKLIASVESSKSAPAAMPTGARKAKEGHKFIKARILNDDGDLEWALIEVPSTDKRKGVDPTAVVADNKTDALKGNPMAEQKLGDNDIQVTGF